MSKEIMSNEEIISKDDLNRKYKDSVFRLIFNNEEGMLELYNALYDTNYPPGTPIDINTIEEALYLSDKNDISFTIAHTYLIISEHQSTINPNMPLRDLWYIAEIYKKMVDSKAVFKETMVKLPRPTFVVMYNGTKPMPPESTLELSDCFLGSVHDEGKRLLNLRVIVYNVNEGAGCSLLEKSPKLYQYSQLVSLVREYSSKGPITHRERQQIYIICMERGILVDFMKEHGKTIIDMLCVELTEEEKKQLFMEDGFEQGQKAGQEKERKRLNKLNDLLLEADRIEDLKRATKDPAYQQQLLEEFGLAE